METQFLTAVFKLRRPSAWQRESLNRVFYEYLQARKFLLAWSEENLDLIRDRGFYKKKYSTLSC